jgi:hypothetical protein
VLFSYLERNPTLIVIGLEILSAKLCRLEECGSCHRLTEFFESMERYHAPEV